MIIYGNNLEPIVDKVNNRVTPNVAATATDYYLGHFFANYSEISIENVGQPWPLRQLVNIAPAKTKMSANAAIFFVICILKKFCYFEN